MKRFNVESVFPVIALIILTYALSMSFFGIPPLGKFLDPFIGVVQNEAADSTLKGISKHAVSDPVSVFYDNRGVPHIFAENTQDLYFAQGYVTASLRLWQMDFISYAAAGRLSEIVNEGLLDYDRTQRRIGMLEAAKSSLALMQQDTTTIRAIRAYTKGVNAYISQLGYRQWPLEYKVLNYHPEPWTELKTVLVMKNMGNMLSGYEEDFNMTNLMLSMGEQQFNKYFPGIVPDISPIVKDKGGRPNPALAFEKKPTYLNSAFVSSGTLLNANTWNPQLGSNSWILSGKKTKTGYPILCNDPHLNFSMPAIWLEMQLSAPGMNVYGVCVPGSPAVIIGFNENIAWGITNGCDDVKDWYKLKITNDYQKYEMDGQWINLPYRIEEIKRRNRAPFYDTVYQTIQGPVVYSGSFSGSNATQANHALRWSLHIPSNEVLTYIKLNRAQNYQDYRDAIKNYSCPVLNFSYADKAGNIAVNHQGAIALKWPGQGKFVLDGTTHEHLYTSNIPSDSLPQDRNPADGILFSANQHPTDNNYPYYYNGYYAENRANRIRQLLEHIDSATVSGMMKMQLDNVSYFSMETLPVLLQYMQGRPLSVQGQHALDSMQHWKATYTLNDNIALLYDLWWKKIKDYTWDEFHNYSFQSRVPDDHILLTMLRQEPDNDYFDQQLSNVRETAGDVVYAAFKDAIEVRDSIAAKRGGPQWGNYNQVSMGHMLNISKLGVRKLPSAGAPDAIDAVSATWGPSWRMIVQLGERPQAWGIYPGGQSGNPGSRYYDNFVTDWNKGSYYPLQFFMSATEAKKNTTRKWILK